MLIVLTTLLAAMTLAAGLLLIFEPGAGVIKGVSLSAIMPDGREELPTAAAPVQGGAPRWLHDAGVTDRRAAGGSASLRRR
jgi:hypothetical protein